MSASLRSGRMSRMVVAAVTVPLEGRSEGNGIIEGRYMNAETTSSEQDQRMLAGTHTCSAPR